MEQQLKKYKKLLDSNDLLTNKYRFVLEKEYETLLRKYLNVNNPVSSSGTIINNTTVLHNRSRRGAVTEFSYKEK